MKYAFFALMLITTSSAFAKGPCAADREKFCKDVKPGKGAIVECLKAHEAELSPECKAHGQEAKAKMKEMRDACKDDAEKLCPGMKGRERHKCMREKKDQLSDQCKKAHEEMKEMHQKK